MTPPPTALVIGASSGIGRALAAALHQNGWKVIATARRTELLESLRSERNGEIEILHMDVCHIDSSRQSIAERFKESRIDLAILNAGTGTENRALEPQADLLTIDTNARAFALLASCLYQKLAAQGGGQLVGISSVAGVRAGPAIAYNATKAFASSFLEGLRLKSIGEKAKVAITDIRPGFIDTAMIDPKKAFWVISADQAAAAILRAADKRKPVAYVPYRWKWVAFVYRILPATLLAKAFYKHISPTLKH